MRVCAYALVVICTLGAPAVAQAQEDAESTARARELFARGVALAAEEEFREAAEVFEEAYALHPAASIAYNLANALVELERLVEATAFLERVAEDPTASDDVRQRATELAERVAARTGRLTVHLTEPQSSATIHIDGRGIADDQLDVPLIVHAGEHLVTAEREGTVLEEQRQIVDAGQSAEVTLDPSTWPPVIVSEPVLPVEEPSGSIFTQWWFWTIVGVVVVGAAIGIGVAASGGNEGPLDGNTDPAVVRF